MTAKRRDPKLAGVAGITAEDLAALEAGRITMLDLATRCGVSKQAISRRIARMRSTGASIPTTPTAGASIPAGPILIDAHQAAVSANLGILHRVGGLLESPDALGASAIKALAGAVAVARAELTTLGVLTTNDDAETPTEFVVRVFSDEEHAEIKRRVELPYDYEN